MDHFYKVMRAMGQWEMLDEPSPKVTRTLALRTPVIMQCRYSTSSLESLVMTTQHKCKMLRGELHSLGEPT